MLGRWDHHRALLAWCEKRDACRNFRFDRIHDIKLLPERYPLHQQRSLEHYQTGIVGVDDGQKPA